MGFTLLYLIFGFMDDLLIDLGPDVMAAAHMHGRPLVSVRYCLQTHPHADHLDLSHLLSRSPGFGVVGAPVLNFYASSETLERASQTFERDLAGYSLLSLDAEKELNLKIHPVEPLRPFTFGEYRAIAFPANHALTMGAMLYAVEAGGRCIFMALILQHFANRPGKRSIALACSLIWSSSTIPVDPINPEAII